MKPIIAVLLALLLTGCSMSQLAGVGFNSHPRADAMRFCAGYVDLATPGVSVLAIISLARNATEPGGTSALGRDPPAIMRNCADLFDMIDE